MDMLTCLVTLRRPSPSSQEAIEERFSAFNPRNRASGKDVSPERAPRADPRFRLCRKGSQLTRNPCICHRSANRARNSFPCHTSKNTRLKVLYLPHIQKMAGVGGILLTRNPRKDFYPEGASRLKDLSSYPTRIAALSDRRELRSLHSACFCGTKDPSPFPYLVISLRHYFFSGALHENYKSFPLSRRLRRICSLSVSLR
jgi:hypothetical protein